MLQPAGRLLLIVTIVRHSTVSSNPFQTNFVHFLSPASAHLHPVETVNENHAALPLSDEDESSVGKQVLKRGTAGRGRANLEAEKSEDVGAEQRYRSQEDSATNFFDVVPDQHSTKRLMPRKLSAYSRFRMKNNRRDESDASRDRDGRASDLILENRGEEISKMSENRVPHKHAVRSTINNVNPDYWHDDVWPYLGKKSARRNGRIRYLSPTVIGKKGVKENGTKKSDKKWWHNMQKNPQFPVDEDEEFEWGKSVGEQGKSGNGYLKKVENLAAREKESGRWSAHEYEREKAHGKDHIEQDKSNHENVENGIKDGIKKWHFRDETESKI
uniref:Btz domain-containing protein n=1 Tax=Ascaris lumbricoides TaxID=6252 RepID=A0A0M3HNR3_ASCLU